VGGFRVPKVPFVGRAAALKRLDSLIWFIRTGAAASLLVTGSPGIGKTRLLDRWLSALGSDIAVLRMAGHADEQQLPFAGLHQLLNQHADRLDRLADPRRTAVKAALALGEAQSSTDRFAVASGLHEIVTNWAEEQPVVIVADDAAWLDQSTLQALAFTMRRLAADPVAIVVASRPDPDLRLDDCPELRLTGLDDTSARELLQLLYPDLIPSVATTVLDTAQGVPLGIVDIPAQMSAAERGGGLAFGHPLPLGGALERTYHRVWEDIGDTGRQALLIACLSDLSIDRLVGALRRVGLELCNLEASEKAGLVSIGPSLVVIHPLVRNVIAQAATSAARDQAHLVLAETYLADPVRRAWHLHAVTHGDDEFTARALEEAAEVAAAQAAFAEAGKAAEVAAMRSQTSHDRERRLHSALARYARAGSGPGMQRVLGALVAEAGSAAERARWRADEVGLQDWTLDDEPNVTELIELAGQAAEVDSAIAAELLLRAGGAMMSWRASDGAILRREARRLHPGELSDLQLRVIDDYIAVVAEAGGAEVLRSDWAERLSADDLRDLRFPFAVATYVAALIGESATALATLERVHSLLLETGAVEHRGLVTGVRGFVKYLRGDWTGAEADHTTAVDLCTDTDLTRPLPFVRVGYAQLLAARGDERARDQVGLARARPAPSSLDFLADCSLGLLDLGLGRYDTAIDALRRAGKAERREGFNEPSLTMRFGDLVEALWRSRRPTEIASEIDEFEIRAKAAGRILPLALVARAHALLAPDDEIDGAFQHAVDLHVKAAVPFESARTILLWGERLRRVRRKADARTNLREALGVFDRLGARPWAERARAELAACGERRGARSGAAAELTPQELQVAVAVARGASNPEVAATLCISRRTVEYHLSSVYRKLGVTDRTALADLL
jgi:DNA-binding CsgD family transcriptional regulator